jgi:hypothetical protein
VTVQPIGAVPPTPWQFQTGSIAVLPPPGSAVGRGFPSAALGDPNDPLAWVSMLSGRLYWQAQHAAFYDSYYSGDRAHLLARKLFEDVFGSTAGVIPHLLPPEANLGKVGVDAVAERLRIEGFRVGDGGQDAAMEAMNIWIGNDLDVMWPVAQVESLVKGTSFLLTWPGASGEPVVSVEDATQMVVHRQNVPPYDIDAALKLYVDEWTGKLAGYLWRPGVRYQLSRDGGQAQGAGWSIVGEPETYPGSVPVEELANRTRLMRAPSSELAGVTPLLDVYTLLMADLVVAADTGAFPIRTATGITLARDPSGRPQTPFDVRVDKAMVSENPNAKYGSLPPSDLAGYIAAIDMVLQQVRMLTRAPEHYYGKGAGTNVSGEALKSSESPLVWKSDGLKAPFGVTARRTMGRCLTLADSPNAGQRISVLWKTSETRVQAQDVDAGQKLVAMGVPLEIVLTETIGFAPEVVAQAMVAIDARQVEAQKLIASVQAETLTDPNAAAAVAQLFRGAPGGALGYAGGG